MAGSRTPPNAGKGRPKGSKNKLGADVRGLAQVYTAEAILALVDIMRGHGRARERIPPQARAYAANAQLDRGHGKPPQGHTGEGGQGPVEVHITEHIYPVEERKALGS
jgi:hypothetical protein